MKKLSILPLLFLDHKTSEISYGHHYSEECITLDEDETLDLALICPSPRSSIGVMIKDKKVYCSSTGEFYEFRNKKTGYNVRGSVKYAERYNECISWDEPECQYSEEVKHEEYDISHLYDDLLNRIMFGYKRYIYKELSSISESIRRHVNKKTKYEDDDDLDDFECFKNGNTVFINRTPWQIKEAHQLLQRIDDDGMWDFIYNDLRCHRLIEEIKNTSLRFIV